jgi:hypothetical protein
MKNTAIGSGKMQECRTSGVAQLQHNMKESFAVIALWSSILTLLFVILIYTADYPGIYHDHRISFISDNLAYKPAQAILTICTTLPIWMLLSLCIIDQSSFRLVQFNLFALPVSSGVGLVLFDIVRTKSLHYFFTGIFIFSILLSHPIVAVTGSRNKIPPLHSWYWTISFVALISGSVFGVLALISVDTNYNVVQSISALFEITALLSILILNMSAGTRALEHLEHKCKIRTDGEM